MLEKLLKERRSIRKYQNREVEKEKIDTILKSALLSPSSRSRRPWEFICVTDKELLEKLSKCRNHSSAFLAGAYLGIVVIADPELSDVWIEDLSITSIIMQLTTASLDLGSCWIQVRERFNSKNEKVEAYIKEILDIPNKYVVESIISIGYPDETKAEYKDCDLSYNKVHYESFSREL